MKAFRVKYDKVIIRGNDHNETFSIADTALFNFFYDFNFAIHNNILYVCTCKYFDKVFLGKKNAVACDANSCQSVYQRESKNTKRRKRENGTYKVYSTRLSNYIGQQKTKLSAEMLYEMFLTAQITILDNGKIRLAQKKECLNRSVVTTPTEIVKYMVEKALSHLCDGKNSDKIC